MSNIDSQNPTGGFGEAQSIHRNLAILPARLAPIALFVYNRPEHTQRTVEALAANDLAQKSDLYVFADGARNESAAAAVEAVRKLICSIDGFKSVTIVERDRNLGLAASVIRGVTQVCEEFARAIAVEDDLLTSPDFLTFMNFALERYMDEPRVFSVSGFNYAVKAPEAYLYESFFAYRSSSWGWGTWKDRWQKADWNVSDYACFNSDRNLQRSFNRGGEDLSRMLALQMAGELDSWAIRWAYTHWKHDAFAVLPTQSRVFNIGLDGSGVHCRSRSTKQSPLEPEDVSEIRFPLEVDPDPRFAGQIYCAHSASLARRFAQFMFRLMKNKRRHLTATQDVRIVVPSRSKV